MAGRITALRALAVGSGGSASATLEPREPQAASAAVAKAAMTKMCLLVVMIFSSGDARTLALRGCELDTLIEACNRESALWLGHDFFGRSVLDPCCPLSFPRIRSGDQCVGASRLRIEREAQWVCAKT